MNETRQLAEFVVNTKYEDIPAKVIEQAKIFLLDNFACGLVGSVQPWSKMVADMVQEFGCREECTVIGESLRTSPSGAALVNGVMIGAFESEHADPVGVHPGGNVFPALAAISERDHKDGRAFILAMILGYEVVVRVGEAATRAVEDDRGFHSPGTNGPFGAAAAVGKILGFDRGMLLNALGIAGSHSAGLVEFKWEGAMTKRLHLGRGGQMGLESALLARRGFTGPSTILEGRNGYLKAFSSAGRPELLVRGLGETWLSAELQFIKPYSCHGTQLPIVEALLRLKSEHEVIGGKIRKVVVSGSHHMVSTHDDRAPRSIMGAQYSMPFIVAIALLKDIANPYILNEDTLWDPGVRELATRVEVLEDRRFDAYDAHQDPHAEIVVEMDDARYVVAAAGFRGLPSNPFDFNDACEKFDRYGTPIIGDERARIVIDEVSHIEEMADISDLMRLVAR